VTRITGSKTTVLPFTRRPYPNELLTSWLGRIAALYGTSWQSLFRDLNVRNLPEVRDYGTSPKTLAFLAAITRNELQNIQSLDLARRFPQQPVTRFLCHPQERLAVSDVCGLCLEEDSQDGRDQYLRHEWAIAGVSHCHVHRRLLSSHCAGFYCEEFEPLPALRSGQVRLLCYRCQRPVGNPYVSENLWPNIPDLHSAVMRFEQGIISGLRRPRSAYSFKVIQDIAFLVSYMRFPWSVRHIKWGLGGWGEAFKVSLPLRRYEKIGDACQLHPLSTVDARFRCQLTAPTMAITRGMRNIMLFSSYVDPEEASLRGLFSRLPDTGCEEFMARANDWPPRLQRQVKQIVNDPDAHYSRDAQGRRIGWAVSEERRRINDGRVPKYSYF
jgi:hypothetical protein